MVRHACHVFFRHGAEGFEWTTGPRSLQLVDPVGQHRLGLERFLLDGRNKLLLLVNDLLELVHAFVVALLLMSTLVVAVVDRFDVRVYFFNLI